MSNIAAAFFLGIIIAFAARDIIVAIDCNSGIEAACLARMTSSTYEAQP